MTRDFVIQPVAPVFGVGYREQGNAVFLTGHDSGGSGLPKAAVLIPVKAVNGYCQVVFGQEPKPPPYTADQLFSVAAASTNHPAEPPDQFEFELTKWPAHGDFVLLLLLYDQTPNIGRSTWAYAVAEVAAPAPPSDPYFKNFPPGYGDDATDRINKYLASSPFGKLRSGLIRQHAAPPTPQPLQTANPDARSTASAARQIETSVETSITFALASCQYPSDILDRMPSDEEATPGPADASLLALGRLLDPAGGPSLLLLMGDQVYVDATAGMFDPKQLDDKYRIPYQRRGESRGVQYVEQRTGLQRHKLIDDHEIDDNWDPGSRCDPRRGLEAYWRFQRPGELAGKVWRDDVVHGGLPFFLGDTRTKREARTATDWGTMKIMGDVQFNALLSWLVKPDHAGLPKFVATPSAFLPRSLAVKHDPACALHADAWDGYPWSQHALLRHICDHQVKGLVFLSGDQHISNMVEACVSFRDGETTRQCTFYSIHSSALYAPYPFANAIPEDFARDESFRFPDPGTGPYSCRVRALFAPPGDGFALVKTMRTAAGGWEIQVVFHDATGPKKDLLPAVTLI